VGEELDRGTMRGGRRPGSATWLYRGAWRASARFVACSALLVACGQSKTTRFDPDDVPSESSSTTSRVPPPPRVAPELPETIPNDADGNRVDDALDREVSELEETLRDAAHATDREAIRARLAEPVRVLVMFREPVGEPELASFERGGGSIQRVFRNVAYGFSGTLPRERAANLAPTLGDSLLLIERGKKLRLHLDEATRGGRVRESWTPNFTGFSTGFSASSSINIAIVDSGVDASHPDLAGRGDYWVDVTSDRASEPLDVDGHGTHVAGIALGTGAAFGVGPAPLLFTDSYTLESLSNGQFLPFPLHLPATSLTLAGTASWSGGTFTRFSAFSGNDGSRSYDAVTGMQTSGYSPLTLTRTFTPSSTAHYTFGLEAPASTYTITGSVTNYPAVGDGFPALRGVASGAHWGGVRVFRNDGESDGLDLLGGLDDLIDAMVAGSFKVVNMSLGLAQPGEENVFFRQGINTLVANGAVVVVSAGNDGPSGLIGDPGRARFAITVGATSDVNRLTGYSSVGLWDTTNGQGKKPDLVAPGGSVERSEILAPDSNDTDARGIPDARANDYASKHGTSMAAPFVSGAAALVIQALESTGVSWTFADESQPLLVKMLLGAAATETGLEREGSVNNPALGRASAPKDQLEGWGIVNPDAAIEAVRLDLAGGFSGTTAGGVHDRRAWGRRVALESGDALNITLAASGADFDLYLYAGTPRNPGPDLTEGEPDLLASSTTAGSGADEAFSYTAPSAGTRYLFVKRVSGSGSFTLVSSGICGNGHVDPGEGCDDGNRVNGDCCNSGCLSDANGTRCDDADACTRSDACQGGVCVGSNPVSCSASDACHAPGSCSKASGLCSNPERPDDTPCPNGTCQSGLCVPDGGGGTAGVGGGGRGGGAGAGASSGTGQGGSGGVTAGAGGGGGSGGNAGGQGASGGAGGVAAGAGGVAAGAGGVSAGGGGGQAASTGSAGAGGATSGAGGNAASANAGGNAASANAGAGGAAGASDNPEAGGESAGGAGEQAAGEAGSGDYVLPKRTVKTTRGCGCEVPGKPVSSGPPGLFALFALAFAFARQASRSSSRPGPFANSAFTPRRTRASTRRSGRR
jgi:cysteine-rich repeat protein